MTNYNNPSVGCYIDASSGSADECDLRTIEFAERYGFEHDLGKEEDPDESQALSNTADDAVAYLNELETRSHMYWTHEDNSLFLAVDVDNAREDVGFVSSKSQDYPDDDYTGEWLHISDHGNVTLYVRDAGKDREVWSVV